MSTVNFQRHCLATLDTKVLDNFMNVNKDGDFLLDGNLHSFPAHPIARVLNINNKL